MANKKRAKSRWRDRDTPWRCVSQLCAPRRLYSSRYCIACLDPWHVDGFVDEQEEIVKKKKGGTRIHQGLEPQLIIIHRLRARRLTMKSSPRRRRRCTGCASYLARRNMFLPTLADDHQLRFRDHRIGQAGCHNRLMMSPAPCRAITIRTPCRRYEKQASL